MARCAGCSSTDCSCSLQVMDSPTVNLTKVGAGTSGDPWVITADVITETSYIEVYHPDQFNDFLVPWVGADLVTNSGTAFSWINDPDWGGYIIKILENGIYSFEAEWKVYMGANGSAAVRLDIDHYGPAPVFPTLHRASHQHHVSGLTIGNTWEVGHISIFPASVGDVLSSQPGLTSGTLEYLQVRQKAAKIV